MGDVSALLEGEDNTSSTHMVMCDACLPGLVSDVVCCASVPTLVSVFVVHPGDLVLGGTTNLHLSVGVASAPLRS